MVEVSRDGRRIYFTNSLYSPWDEQFYPDGVRSWMVKLNSVPTGGLEFDSDFFLEFGGILARLSKGEARVTELSAPLPISLNAVSKHIKIVVLGKSICVWGRRN